MNKPRANSPSKSPHPPLAIASGSFGVVSVISASLPPIRGLAGKWLQLLAAGLGRAAPSAPVETNFSALYLLPFLVVLVCSLAAIVLGVLSHIRAGFEYQVAGQRPRSQLATVGILAGGVALWLLLRI